MKRLAMEIAEASKLTDASQARFVKTGYTDVLVQTAKQLERAQGKARKLRKDLKQAVSDVRRLKKELKALAQQISKGSDL